LKQIILGTAGHIDHGKTSLIKKITGIDTDRLKEEKLRGITIELGFAYLTLPNGQHIGIVDVPGHEKFVKNMVAGATGIDIVAMVIAADEGVMPQTREHLEICELLDIKYGCVVLTKIDLVDEEWLELVTEDVSQVLAGTFLEDAPMIPVSSVTGDGIAEFIKYIEQVSEEIPERTASGIFRLPVDRVFSMKGFGTVITGTLISGKIHVGDAVMIYPSGITSKVRGIQAHNQSLDEARAGMRTAINFQGLEKESVLRGHVVSAPDQLKPSYMVDVFLKYLSGNKKPVKNRTCVRFHSGTSEVLGVIILLDRDELAPGETAVVQMHLDTPVALVKDDRYVIRSYSPVRTVGGGYILNPVPKKHKRFASSIVEGLNTLVENDPEAMVAYYINASGYKGILFSDFKIMTNMSDKQIHNILAGLLSKKSIVCIDKENRIYIHMEQFEKLTQEIHDCINTYHKVNPLKSGMPKEELKSKFKQVIGGMSFNHILTRMLNNNDITSEGDIVRLNSHEISLGVDQTDLKNRLFDLYLNAGLTPPYFKDVGDLLGIDSARVKEVLMLLINEKLIIKAKEDLYFEATAVNKLKEKLTDFLQANQEITTPQFKEIACVSRKYLIPLIEYFDSEHVTLRIGDVRKLRRG
jgi:selenocysteine-specific elongation factor